MILNYNVASFTISYAELVLDGNLKTKWLVIVHNSSSDSSRFIFEDMRRGKKNIIYLPQAVNKRYAGGNNARLRWLLQGKGDAAWI